MHKHQKMGNVEYQFFTVSNCLVNMISPEQYRDFVKPFDLKISHAFGLLGIHNCAWNADPYIEYYAKIPNLGYIDMCLKSDLTKSKSFFPDAQRSIMYTPMDLNSKPLDEIKENLDKIFHLYAPCDFVVADIKEGTPDEKIIQLLQIIDEIKFS